MPTLLPFQKKWLLFIFTVVVSLVLTVFVFIPSFIFVLIPLYICRVVVSIMAKIFKTDLEGMIASHSALLALDDLRGRPTATLLGVGIMEGPLTVEAYRKSVSENVLTLCSSNSRGEEKVTLPELRQYYETWFGFSFWKQDTSFAVENHVNIFEHNYNFVDELRLLEITKELERKPYIEKRSPWEIHLVKNIAGEKGDESTQKERWAVIYRMHHGLGDGYTLIKKVILASDVSPDTIQMPLSDKRTWIQGIALRIFTILIAPYYICSQFINAYDVNPWHLTESKITRHWNVARSDSIPVPMIKAIKKSYNVAFTDVLIASIAGGVRKYIMTSDTNDDINNFPRKMHAIVGQPWPDHPWKMCNHWTFGYLQLPIGCMSAEQKLRICHHKLNQLKRSPAPVVNFFLFSLLGSLPNCLLKKLCKNILPTMIISNIPAPAEKLTFCGNVSMVDSFFWGGLTRGNLGIGVAILSYNDRVRFILTVDKAILRTQEETSRLTSAIHNEILEYYVLANKQTQLRQT